MNEVFTAQIDNEYLTLEKEGKFITLKFKTKEEAKSYLNELIITTLGLPY